MTLWTEIAARASVPLSDAQVAQLHRYLDLLLDANQRMNLTRITDRAAAEVQHVADALTVLPFLPPGPHRLADVGSGGGIPGLVLAIARPDTQVALIEATGKKAAFLESAIIDLHLSNVAVRRERAETTAQGDFREDFDVAVCRAVATMVWLAEWCLPLVRKGGKMLAMKGPRVHDELPEAAKAIRSAGGGPPHIHPVELPDTTGHVIVEIPKVGRSDPRIPRPPTTAKGRPIS